LKMACLCSVASFLFKALSSCVMLATIGLALSEAARPLVDVPFDALLPEHFRGAAIYALGLLHGALMLSGRKTSKKSSEEVVAAPSDLKAAVEEDVPPPPPTEPHPDDTPRTLLKGVAVEAAPAVHTPEVMTIDDYEAIKENMKVGNQTPSNKSATKRRKSIRTPKAVSRLSPS